MEENYSVFYTDLDTIMDTRLATIFTMDQYVAAKLIASGYNTRTQDVFEGIDFETYHKIYANRDKRILAASVVTKVPILIREFAEATCVSEHDEINPKIPKLLVNTSPYELDEEEKHAIVKGIAVSTEGKIDIELTNMSIDDLSPDWVHKNIDMMAMYNYNTWLDRQAELKRFENQTCCETLLFAPRVVLSKEMPDVDLDALFIDLEKFISPFVGIRFIDVDTFSAVMRIVPNEEA